MIINEMDRAACMALLESSRMGRLACAREGQPYVVPITFSVHDNYLYSFSLLGRKVDWMRENAKVCVQADEFGEHRQWQSVIVYGLYEELPDRIGWKVQRERAWSLLSQHANWWEPGSLKPSGDAPAEHLFYRIRIEEITGRQARTNP